MPTRPALLVLGLVLVSTATASTVVVNFETVPPEPTGPSTGNEAIPETITVPGVATFSGGAIFGNPTLLTAIIYATPPNLYGTFSGACFVNGHPIAVCGYSDTLSITVDPTFTATEVSFTLFNGEPSVWSYVATAFAGATQVAQQTLFNLPANTNLGYALADLTASDITSVTITSSVGFVGFDFFIDTVAFNGSVTAVSPEPGSLILLGSGLLGLAAFARRRNSVREMPGGSLLGQHHNHFAAAHGIRLR